jgi:hypothetical protein
MAFHRGLGKVGSGSRVVQIGMELFRSPHPEEQRVALRLEGRGRHAAVRRLRLLSPSRRPRLSPPSFETRLSGAPQDEGFC